ncbi:MAG: tetratricopeptide repeat protein [Candidatus Zixiibacteriota bacterium]
MRYTTRFVLLIMGVIALVVLTSGCSVYFNTFFNAKKAFNSAEKARKESKREGAGRNEYQKAIEKALKVAENHPNSKYYDDAIYVLGVSYYHTAQYAKAERRFRELLANYPNSKYTRDATIYLAKSKLALGDMDDALAAFAAVFDSGYDKEYKAEAARALGEHHHKEKEYSDARRYFVALRDSLGDGAAARNAQMFIADGYFEAFQFQDALSGYLQVLGMKPDKGEKYHALYQAGLCSIRLQRIDAGLAYLNQLAKDELYFDSLGILKLTMAEGYEYDGDLAQAEALYEDVMSTSEKKSWQAIAAYRLGLIYQIDYDQLSKAQEYYDKSVEIDKTSPVRSDAIVRSSDIGKLKTFARTHLDSTATPAAIETAANTQLLLAELYWSKLNKPDSAIAEMHYLVDSIETSYHTPQAIIMLSQMIREHTGDNQAADSMLQTVLQKYPHSDFVPEALEALGLEGTEADSGYAALYIDRAEDFLINGEEIDSARTYYQYVVDNFPESDHYLPARFALIWLRDNYEAPGDSSIYYAYKEFIDSFPDSEWSRTASRMIGGAVQPVGQPTSTQEEQLTDLEKDSIRHGDTRDDIERPPDTAVGYIDPMIALYRTPKGDTLVDLRLQPIETQIPFEFPPEFSTGTQNDWKLYFQLLIDFSGKVVDYNLKIPSGIEEIDKRARETVGSMTFDAMEVSNRVVDAGQTDKRTEEGYWFVYMYVVTKPEYLR